MILKNIFLGSLIFLGLSSFGQVINFPDSNFKNALVNTKCVDNNGDGWGDVDADLNDDGEIDVSEALNVFLLNVNVNSITNLDGIENFKNLTSLNCSNNELTSLNLKELTRLTTLKCSINKLTSLDIQGLTNLEYLECAINKLKSIKLEGLANLKNLMCQDNQLISINLQGLNNLNELRCDYNQLTSLSIQGLAKLTDINCGNNQLISLNEQELTNLKVLYCAANLLTSLNIQELTNLEHLFCQANSLTSLNVEKLTNLKSLWCGSNPLTTLNIEGLTKLENLSCDYIKTASLNLERLTNLEFLSCEGNQLSSLNVEKLVNLKCLYCGNNQLSSIDVKGLTKLERLLCEANQLTSLNLQGLTKLQLFSCNDNQLNTLNIKGTKISDPRFDRNQGLNYICCNEDQIINIKNKAISNGQNCEVNSYCTFTPGGKYYVLKGKNMFDFNNNGCEGQGINLKSTKFNITNTIGNITGVFISNSTGNYSIPLQEGTHIITPILEHPSHFEVTPTSYNVTFPSASDTITQDFCITPKGILRQTNITVIPLSPPARPGFDASYKIVWENVGNQIESGTLNFTYDETLLDYISATQTADQVADGIIKWNFTNLLPFEKREITVTLKVNRPTDTPAVNAGDKLYLTASILDNIFTLENTVVGSYDPNDKTCLQGDRVKPDMVGEYVDYLIRFENTGNYAAENVVIKDIIDIKTFDVSTLKITDASHEVYTRIEGNKVEFIFENIQLPFDDANNDGYIAFKIKTLPSLVLGDSLKNLADIYFEYNFPIRTNEAQTTVAFPVFTKDINTEVNIYPNPVTDILYLDTNENWTTAEIYDIAGRIMRSISLNGQSMDVSGLESGTYFIRLKDRDRVGLVKFVKM